MLNKMFYDAPVDFKKKCKTRMLFGTGFCFLGLLSAAIAFFPKDGLPILYLEPGSREFFPGFYGGLAWGLTAAGIILMIKNYRYLKNPELRHKKEIQETDERNRMLGLRCWAYSGYTMFILLYLGILVSGFISVVFVKLLLAVLALHALLLLFFRLLLQKFM